MIGVVGFLRDPDHGGDRVRCATPGLAAEQVERFLRDGYAYVHLDNEAILNRQLPGQVDRNGDLICLPG